MAARARYVIRRATLANTSSNQAIKDPGQRRCGYSNLGKIIVIKLWRLNMWLRGLWLRVPRRKIPLARHPPITVL